MARLARIVVPDTPHHVTQRGNRRQSTFFETRDYRLYLELLREWTEKFRVEVDAYCLMPNHVHLILVPSDEIGLTRALSEVHRRYTRHVNFRESWRGHLWQGRFFSVPLDESHHDRARTYVEQNPVRAGLVAAPELYPWSSASLSTSTRSAAMNEDDLALIRRMTATGRPEGSTAFFERIQLVCGVDPRPRKAGRKPRREIEK